MQCENGRSDIDGLRDERQVALRDDVREARRRRRGRRRPRTGCRAAARRTARPGTRRRPPGPRGRRPRRRRARTRAWARRRAPARSPRSGARRPARPARPPRRARAARASRPGCGSSSCGRGSARGRCARGPWLKKSTQPGTTTCGRPSRPGHGQPLGAGGSGCRPAASWPARTACSRRRPAARPPRTGAPSPARRRRWRGRSRARDRRLESRSRSRITPGVVWPEHRDPDAVLAERARAPSRRRGPCPPSPPRRCRRSAARCRSARGCRPPSA